MNNPTNIDQVAPRWLRPAAWASAAVLILIPLLTMRVSGQLNWEVGDFMFAILMVGGVGLAFELAVRASRSWSYRAGAALGLGAAFLLTWGNLAVGMVGSEDNPLNLIYFAIPAVAAGGALLARLRAAGMALAMMAAGVAQVVAGIVALMADAFTGPLTIFFTGLWLASAWLFRRAALAQAGG